MRLVARSWSLALALMALGCSGSHHNSPTLPGINPEGAAEIPGATPEAPGNPAGAMTGGSVGSTGLGHVLLQNDLAQSALAIYTVNVDAASLSASAHLQATRQATANDDLYLLPIDSFLKDGSFKVSRVGKGVGTIDIGYEFAHPFPAPSDPTGTPNGSTNRADLGVAVSLILLADVADPSGNTYFTDRVANTRLVRNADAYVSPGGLLDLTGYTANTFPFFSVVDEVTDNRVGVSNNADVMGNFGLDGWTRDEMNATHDQWSGFGILHQGQTVKGVVSLDTTELQALGSFTFDVAVTAKYNDPRGGANGAQKKANRLPPATPDPTKFAYRMPHGALDVSRVQFTSESGGFYTNLVSASTLGFHVTDWDARAIETAETDLALESDVTKVAIGEAGLPALAVCIPGVLGDATAVDTWDASTTVADDDTLAGGDPGLDSGRPGDDLFYSKSVTKLVTTGQTDGTYSGMARATDVEVANITDPLFVLELDGTLTPLSTNIPLPETYQAFTVDLITPNDPPTATVAGPATPVASGNGVLTITTDPYNDADNDVISIRFDWNNDGDFNDLGEAYQPLDGTAPDSFNSPIFYDNADLVADSLSVPYEFTDSVIPAPITGTANFTLSANQVPTGAATTWPSGTVPSGSP
ncbi:MAG: hypothetical protein ABI743_04330, partial [bacterium]